MPHVVLLGSMGAGKTTVGRALAARLGWRYWDNDAELRTRAGRSAAGVADAVGVPALHALEAAVLRAGLALPSPAVVSAPGSAALLCPSLGDAEVVWLRARPSTLAARLGGGGGDRPDLGPVSEVDEARRRGFAALATFVVDVDDLTAEEVADAIVRRIGASARFLSQGSVTVAGCASQESS